MSTPNIRALVFDLDDTLYDEIDYVRSGFGVVGGYLQDLGFGSLSSTVHMLEAFHHEDRKDVLQRLAQELRFSDAIIPELVRMHREHAPRISLGDDAVAILPKLRSRFRLGCVTDGWLPVQQRKVGALGLESRVDVVVYADEFGRDQWKPHSRPFHTCCERLGVLPGEVVFIGDNPERDIVGARRAGLRSIRIRRPRGYFSGTEVADATASADAEIVDLEVLPTVLDLLPDVESLR